MSIALNWFKFTKKTSAKEFYKYKIINNNPYDKNFKHLGNSIRYRLLQLKENKVYGRKIFIYADSSNTYLYTYDKIINIPCFKDNGVDAELKLESHKLIPLTEETIDLYSHWIKYFFYVNMIDVGKIMPNKYDYRIENEFSTYLNTPKNNLGVQLRRVFSINTKVLLDGTSYLQVVFKCKYDCNNTIYDYIKQGIDIVDMKVTCQWQSFNRTYLIHEVLPNNINEIIPPMNQSIFDYWYEKNPRLLQNIDANTTPIVMLKQNINAEPFQYIPQSLKPVITRLDIAKDKRFSKIVDSYTKLSMQKRLNIVKEFLNDINSTKKGMIINLEPISAEEFGYKYFDCTKNIPRLLIGNGKTVDIKNKKQAFTHGFFKNPIQNVYIGYMCYNEKSNDCRLVAQAISDYLNKGEVNHHTSPYLKRGLLPIKVYPKKFAYEKGNKFSYSEVAHQLKKESEINFALSVLPIEVDESEFYEESSPYDAFKQTFAELNIPSQMVSLSMLNDVINNNKNIEYRLQNIALGILSKSGGIPWILEKPLNDVDCFIGLDVGKQDKGIHYPACSVCLDGQGNLLGYYSTNKAQKGEKIDILILEDILNKVLMSYKENNGRLPKHIVIHRDGFSNEIYEWYKLYFGRMNIQFDLVEVIKSNNQKMMDLAQLSNEYNALSGSCIIKDNTAHIITTDIKSYLGSPNPLTIIHRHGNLSMEDIVKQIYVLSELHVGSTRSSRLPITTFYADKICKHHNCVPHNVLDNKLYFL